MTDRMIATLVAIFVGVLIAVASVAIFFQVRSMDRPPAGTLTFTIRSSATNRVDVKVMSFNDHGEMSSKYWVLNQDPNTFQTTVDVPSDVVNVTVIVPEKDVDCDILWMDDDGNTEQYSQHDTWDDILIPKCDWKRP